LPITHCPDPALDRNGVKISPDCYDNNHSSKSIFGAREDAHARPSVGISFQNGAYATATTESRSDLSLVSLPPEPAQLHSHVLPAANPEASRERP